MVRYARHQVVRSSPSNARIWGSVIAFDWRRLPAGISARSATFRVALPSRSARRIASRSVDLSRRIMSADSPSAAASSRNRSTCVTVSRATFTFPSAAFIRAA